MEIRIATRNSPLALWQAQWVEAKINRHFPGIKTRICPMTTTGDQHLNPLNKIGGKGLFTKELEQALLNNEADIAVHSMKDVPNQILSELTIGAICERGPVEDILLSEAQWTLDTLPQNARIGTSSLRRQAQIKKYRPDLQMVFLRGNLQTRLQRLMSQEMDAIILAYAGIHRLGIKMQGMQILPTNISLPAPGQGAIGIECRRHDEKIKPYLACLDHQETHIAVQAERQFAAILGGNCQVPLAAYAYLQNNNMTLRAFIGHAEKAIFLENEVSGSIEDAQKLAQDLGELFLSQGAKALLADSL